MDPVDVFFRSVRKAFGGGDDALSRGLLFAVAGAVVIAVALFVRERYRRRRQEAAAVARLMAERRLSASDVDHISGLAHAAHVLPSEVMTSLAAFERVTARWFATRGRPPMTLAPEDPWSRLGRLRRQLGFTPLPPYAPLLSTRELSSETDMRLAGTPARVVEVTEAFFVVEPEREAVEKLELEVDAVVPCALVRADDARYSFGCRLMAVENRAGSRRLFFAHDERPRRIQLRDAVRVRVQRPVALTLVEIDRLSLPASGDAAGAPATPLSFVGHTVDVSVGGFMAESPVEVPVGARLTATFELSPSSTFTGIGARVVGSMPLGDGRCRLHVSFEPMSRLDQDRLSSAVAQLDAQSAAVQRDRHSSGNVTTSR